MIPRKWQIKEIPLPAPTMHVQHMKYIMYMCIYNILYKQIIPLIVHPEQDCWIMGHFLLS